MSTFFVLMFEVSVRDRREEMKIDPENKDHSFVTYFGRLRFTQEEWKVVDPLLSHLEYEDITDLLDMAFENVAEDVNRETAMKRAFPLFKEAMIRKLRDEQSMMEGD
jgi:hypothetical protein